MRMVLPTNRRSLPMIILFILLCGVAVSTYLLMTTGNSQIIAPTAVPQSGAQYLSTAATPPPKPFRLAEVPSWLFLHVGIIAALQVLALMAGAIKSTRVVSARDARTVQFLVEIPMYLGLFGTLLGVCLTQFVSGALTAPLAYLTTMSGILLHVFGKLTILLPLPDVAQTTD